MRVLTFRLARGRYAISLDEVTEVAPPGAIRPVPGTPPTIRGLTERRGHVVALLDAPRLLDDAPPDGGEVFLVRLGAPRDGTALWIPARVASGEAAPEADGTVLVDGESHRLLDLADLVRRAAA